MAAPIPDFLSLLGDPRLLLGSAFFLLLLNYLLWELLHSHPLGERISHSPWGRHLQPPILPKILAKLRPVIEWVRSRARDLEAAQNTRGILMRLLPSTEEETVSRVHWASIRQLLCDDPACTVCERAARETGPYADATARPSSHGPGDPKSRRKGPQRFTRSASEPAPTSLPMDFSPVRPASSLGPPGAKEVQSPSFEEPAAPDWEERSHPSSHHSGMEVLASSSSTYVASRFTQTKSSSDLSELSVGSLTLSRSTSQLALDRSASQLALGRSVSQLQITLTQQADFQVSLQTEGEASSEHTAGQRRSPLPQKRPCSQTSLPRSEAQSPTGAVEEREAKPTTADVPFLPDAVVATLESHVLVKRVQHYLGLPVALLRSLRSFMLPAPPLTFRRRRREFGVVTRPQALPFVSSGTRKKLELHLSRMVRLKRWDLPRRIHGALGQMRSPLWSNEAPRGQRKPPSAVRKQGPPGVTGQGKGTRRAQRIPARLPPAAGVLDSKTTPASQAELQSHLVKKSLEIRLETFPTIVGHSQKMTWRARVPRLPKSILLGQSCPQLRNRLCLVLRNKADTVDMNIKCKYLHFLWGLPTLHMQSLSKLAPRAPALSTAPAWLHASIEFVSMEPPFVGVWSLEYHVLRKRLQHQWGLPSLVLRSVKQFLVPLPPLPARDASVRCCSRLKVKVLIGDTLFLLSHLEMKEKLETHVKTKIIERRWGLPRRALDSLRVFIPVTPPPVQRPKQPKKTLAQPKGQKVAKRKPPARRPGDLKKLMDSAGKALERHLAKKALEVRLGAIAPRAQRSQAAARRAQKTHKLPKPIPPGLKPLVPRPQELLFVDPPVLGHLQLNLVHKGLMYRWGLITAYKKSLARLFKDTGPPAVLAQALPKPTEPKFTAMPTPFVSRPTREVLEWHVRRKSLQHTWGIPVLIQRSLRYLLPAVPSFYPRKGRRAAVAVSLTEPSFLSNAARRELERNVQKRIFNQRWHLPRRVLDSLRLLQPTWAADALRQNPPGLPFAQSKGSCLRKAGRPNRSAPPVTSALCNACYMKELWGAAPQRSQGFPMLRPKRMGKMELHWTKKCMEVQLGVFPMVLKRSWKRSSLTSQQRLPKLIPAGRRPRQPRKGSLSLVSQEDAGRMEVAVQTCHLMSLWGLGTRYVEGLRAMIPGTPARSPRRPRRPGLEFSAGKVLFLAGQALEALEFHVRRKRLQHEWGLPVLVRRSVQAFVQGSPQAPAARKTTTHIETLQQDLAFLPRGACGRLEHHLQRLKLQRQWGLPLRVLKSLYSLVPGAEPPHSMQLSRVPFSTKPSSRLRGRRGPRGAAEHEPRNRGAPGTAGPGLCLTCRGSALQGRDVKKLQQHLAKKFMEIHLEAFPTVPRLSWRRSWLSLKQPLPKVIPPGHRVLEPRRSSFPFLRAEELDRVEVALRCSRLASLWGLETRYVEAVVAMVPRMPSGPGKSRRAAFGLPAGKLPSFPGLDPAALEMHIQRKRLQHEWGLPALALRSLKGFMQGAPAMPHLSKTVIDTYVLPQVLPFLPQPAHRLLDFHIQRMKLQRAWGLPGRILASLRAFIPSASFGNSSFTLHYKEERSELARSRPGETRRPLWEGKRTPSLCLKQKGLDAHLRRKYLETHLEAFPPLVRRSQAAARSWKKTPLPKLVRAGQKHPTSRAVSLSFLQPATVDLLEVNVKHKHLAFLWGLPGQYMEPLSMFATRGHPPVRLSGKKVRFQEAKTPFCPKEARERLEHHIQRKRLHHHWGLPATIQRSLHAWAPTPSTYTRPRGKTYKDVNVLVADILFVSALAQKKLEISLKKMIIHGRWGLPKRLQGYLRAFAPTPLAERQPQKDRAADGGIMASMPGMKQAQLSPRPRQATAVGLVSRQAPSQAWGSPILGLFRSSKIRALENHLQKKSLEIKFQLPAVGVGTVTRAPLPKCAPLSPVVKPRGAVLFVEPEALLKIKQNIKHKYLTYLWGLPSLHMESLKKMFGTVPEWPQKGLLGKEARWKGRGAAHTGKGTGSSAGFGSRPFLSPTVKLTFLGEKASDLLERHVRHKKLQHEWGLPSTIQKSLRAFAPFPSETRRRTPSLEQAARRPCGLKVNVSPQTLLFLDPAKTRHLEEHLRSRIVAHRWGIPKRVQQSLKLLLPPATLSQRSKDRAQTLLCQCDQIPPAAARHPLSEAGGLWGRVTSRDVSPRRGLSQKGQAQQPYWRAVEQPAVLSPKETHRDKTTRHRRQNLERKPLHTAQSLPSQAWDLLEFHIRRRRIQHEWGLPSMVQKSLQAFAPLPPDKRAVMKPRAGAYLAAKGLRAQRTAADPTRPSAAQVSVPFQATMFLDPDVRRHLEAHVRSRTVSHRWGLPKLVQDSLGAFLPPEPPSQTRHPHSYQQHEAQSDSEGKKSPELLRVEHRRPEKRASAWQGRPVATTRPGKKAAVISPELKPSFLPDELLGLLAFHIQHKKVQHFWGMPIIALRSLHTFAPFPFEKEKDMRRTGKSAREMRPWSRGEVRAITPSLLFLSPDTKLHLENHLSNMIAKHRWGLPALVQQSLKAFLPPAPSSPSKGAQGQPLTTQPHISFRGAAAGGGQLDDAKHEAMPGRRRTRNRESSHQKKQATAFSSPAQKLPFLTREAQELLEFHMQRKKVQHLWGLPMIVLKSLHVFAPFEKEKDTWHTGKGAREMRPWSRGEVRAITPSLLFLSPDTKLHLENHLSNMITKHRWGLPALVQQSLKAFLPPAPSSPSKGAQGQPLTTQPHISFRGAASGGGQLDDSKREVTPRRRRTRNRESSHQKKQATAFSSPAGKLPFLTREAQELLEFHMQRKKVQHLWGLPMIVLKSLHVFAPFEKEKDTWHTGKGAREMRPWSRGEVRAIIPSLLFLSPDTKLHLENHLSNMITKHRWGLPAMVQQSLKAFLPPAPSSPSKGAQPQPLTTQPHISFRGAASGGGQLDDAKHEAMPGRRRTRNRESSHQKKQATAFSSPAQKLPFLTREAQEFLEFHMQRKKVQHLWGLPMIVLKSLHVFAPFEKEKDTRHTGKGAREMRPWSRGEVRAIIPSLLFLSPDTKLHLENHLSNMITKHRWGLPALVQQSLKAFLPPAPSSPSKGAQAQPLATQPHISFRGAAAGGGLLDDSRREVTPRRRRTGSRESSHQKKQATAFSSPAGKLPFLTREAQELLEFHMQRKKVQHLWGLPSTVLRSLRTFAPFPHEPAKHAPDAAVATTKGRPWDTEVRIPPQSLVFLNADARERLEAHVRSRTAEHRWGLPKLVQESLRALLPPSISHPGETIRQPLLHRRLESPQGPMIQPQGGTERSVRKLPSRRETSKKPEKEKLLASAPEAPLALSPMAKLTFLPNGNQDALEFHIQRKKIQHEWGLPLTVQKSVHAFAPVPPELHEGAPTPGGGSTAVGRAKVAAGRLDTGAKKPWIAGTVNIAVPSLHFLDPDAKENLEAHLRNLTIEHKWGLPKLVHKSMRAFIPLPSHLDLRDTEDEESPSAYSYDKTFAVREAPFSTEAAKDQHAYYSPHETEEGGGTDSCLDSEEPLFYPGSKPEHGVPWAQEIQIQCKILVNKPAQGKILKWKTPQWKSSHRPLFKDFTSE
ncbi:uncharacterized protein LOC143841702 [Paroedura picta]|uniref:uncharacterized protein LOC143841702 n=1 Tax=Paroedura picta TaxID=143630 RepID=UPI004055C97F